MDINIIKNSSDRITITTDMNAKVENVKVYKGWIADIACWLGKAKKIQDKAGTEYIVNIRSLGKAWAEKNHHIVDATENRVKDLYAGLFFQRIERDSFVKQLNDLFKLKMAGGVMWEINRLKGMLTSTRFIPTDEKELVYNRIKASINTDIIQQGHYPEWKRKIDGLFPAADKLSTKEGCQEILDFLNSIDTSS